MPFDIATVSRLLVVRPVCRTSDHGVGYYIEDNAPPIEGGQYDLRYRVHALIKHRRRRDSYELSLRAYEYNAITGEFYRREDELPPRWQTVRGGSALAVRLLGLLSAGEVVFCGRPSEYTNSGVTFNPEYDADHLRVLACILAELDPATAAQVTALATVADA